MMEIQIHCYFVFYSKPTKHKEKQATAVKHKPWSQWILSIPNNEQANCVLEAYFNFKRGGQIQSSISN